MRTAEEDLALFEAEDIKSKAPEDLLAELESQEQQSKPLALSPHQLEAEKAAKNREAVLRYSGIGPINKIIGGVNQFVDRTLGVPRGPYETGEVTPDQQRFEGFNLAEKALSVGGRTAARIGTGIAGFIPGLAEGLIAPEKAGMSGRGEFVKENLKGLVKMPATVVPTAYELAASIAGVDDPSAHLPESWQENYREMINEVTAASETPIFGAMMGKGLAKTPQTVQKIGTGIKDRLAARRAAPVEEMMPEQPIQAAPTPVDSWKAVATEANLSPILSRPIENLLKEGKIDAAERYYRQMTKDSPGLRGGVFDQFFEEARNPKPVEVAPVEASIPPEQVAAGDAVIAKVRQKARIKSLVKPPEKPVEAIEKPPVTMGDEAVGQPVPEAGLKNQPDPLMTQPEIQKPLTAEVPQTTPPVTKGGGIWESVQANNDLSGTVGIHKPALDAMVKAYADPKSVIWERPIAIQANGEILEGFHRATAAKIAGVEPPMTVLTPKEVSGLNATQVDQLAKKKFSRPSSVKTPVAKEPDIRVLDNPKDKVLPNTKNLNDIVIGKPSFAKRRTGGTATVRVGSEHEVWGAATGDMQTGWKAPKATDKAWGVIRYETSGATGERTTVHIADRNLTRNEAIEVAKRAEADLAKKYGAKSETPVAKEPWEMTRGEYNKGKARRYDEPGITTGGDIGKPHGVYLTEYPDANPFNDLGGPKTVFEINPEAKVLSLTEKFGELRGRHDNPVVGTGVHALRAMVGKERFAELRSMNRVELSNEFKDLGIDFSKYYDKQEVMEAIGASLARNKGYDVIRLKGDMPLGSNEAVILTERGGKVVKDHADIVSDAISSGKPVPPEVLADYPDLAKKYGAKAETPVATTPKEAVAEIIEGRAESKIGTAKFKEQMLAELDKAHGSSKKEGTPLSVRLPGMILDGLELSKSASKEVQAMWKDLQKSYHDTRRSDGIDVAREAMRGAREQGIKDAGLDYVTIQIPGDGEFKVLNTKEAIAEVRGKVNRLSDKPTALVGEGTPKFSDAKNAPMSLDRGLKEGVVEFIPNKKTKKVSTKETEPIVSDKASLGSPGSTARESAKLSMEGKTEPVSKQQVIDHFSKSFNIPIRTGRFRDAAHGVYKTGPQVVRSKSWGDLVNISHEIGHHIEDKVFGGFGQKSDIKQLPKAAKDELIAMGKTLYGDKKPEAGYRSEGFAEFIAHHLTGNDTKALAPTFTDWFDKSFLPANKDIAKTLGTGRDLTSRWYQQGAYSRVYSQIGATPKNILSQMSRPWVKKQVARLKDLWTDSAATIELFEKEVRGVDKITPETVDPKTSPTQLYRADRMAATSKAISMVRDGTFDFDGNKTGPSLKTILKPISRRSKDFLVYAYARRAMDLAKRDINAGISTADANFIVNKYESPVFRKALDDLTQWQGRVLDYVVDAGALTPDAKAAIEALNPVYIPLKRVLDTEGGLGSKKLGDLPDAIKKIHGSGRPIQDPLESIIKQTALLISHADRTRIGRAIAQLGVKKGAGKWIEEIPAPQQASRFTLDQMKGELEAAGLDLAEVDLAQVVTVYQNSLKGLARENIVTFAENGQRKFFQLEPNLYKAAMALDGVQQSLLLRILGAPARSLRMGTTGLNPEFALGVNPVRDAMTFALQSEYAKGLPTEIGRGIVRKFSDNKYGKMWERSGADMSTMMGMDRQSLKKTVGDILADDKQSKAINVVKHPLEAAREILSFTEAGPRLAEFESAYKKLSEKYGEGASARIGAVNAAKDVTTDFTRMGRYGQVANALIPFFNVALQGPAKFGRTVAAHPIRSGVYGTAFITVPTVALWALNKDEEWYRELPAWRKYGFWNFEAGKNDDGTTRIISIPRPFEWGLLFGAGPEAYLNYLNTEDPKQINEAVGSIWDQVSPGVIPQALKVPVELWANYNYFRDDNIVPYYMDQNKPPEEQYFQSTPMTYRKLGELIGYSPLKIQHAVEGVTGSITTRAIKNVEDATGIKPKEEGRQLADVPVLGRFAVRQQTPDERYDRVDFKREQMEAKLRQMLKYGKRDKAEAELTHWNATYPSFSMTMASVEEKSAKLAKAEEDKKFWQGVRETAQAGNRSQALGTVNRAVSAGKLSVADAQKKWKEIDLDDTGRRLKNARIEDAWTEFKGLPAELRKKYKSLLMSKASAAIKDYRAADFTPDEARKRQQVLNEITRYSDKATQGEDR